MDMALNAFLMASAILVMLYCLWQVFTLKAKVPGGVVGRSWRFLTSLVGFFALGYLLMPFVGDLPESTMRLIVSLIFFFGALYVAITIRLIYRVIEELTA